MDNSRSRLTADANRVLFVRNLPYNSSSNDLYDLFGKYGTIRQIRKGTDQDTKGTAFVIYDDIFDAQAAFKELQGFNYEQRYLSIQYYNQQKWETRKTLEAERKELETLRRQWNVESST
eukprot:GDKJ01065053.1.p1 GENE.GDKJ01065053.1~~GDKJ01065053.1.p1  ORF type:complete len:130 (+),score=13.73 GDKJ01065053.1:35-391(+)